MKSTSPSAQRRQSIAARSPERSIAGPLVIRTGAPSSAADDHGQGGLAQAGRAGQQDVVRRCAAAQRALQQQVELLADPGLADEVGQPAGPERASACRSVRQSLARRRGDRRRRGRRTAAGRCRVEGRPAARIAWRCSAPARGAAVLAVERRRPRPPPARPRAADQPSPVSPARTCSARLGRRRGGTPAAASGRRQAAPSRSLSSSTSRWAPLRPMPGHPGQRGEVVGGHGPADRVRRWTRQHRLGEPRPDAAGGLQQLEDRPLVVVGEAVERERVLPDDQASRARRPRPDAQPGERRRARTAPSRPTPPTSTTARPVAGERAPARPTGAAPRRAGGRGDDSTGGAAGVRAARSPPGRRGAAAAARLRRPRHRWQMASARASAASAGRGAARPAAAAGHHRPDLRLVGPAGAGHRGLDLAGGVQRHAAARPGRRPGIATAPAWAVPMTVRTLAWLKTRSTATASGR